MIWSVIPEALIFTQAQPAGTAGPQVRTWQGRQVLIQDGRVGQLLSTDPADFLDQRFAPGAALGEQLTD